MDTLQATNISVKRHPNAISTVYPQAHLLGIPYDIRCQIWHTIYTLALPTKSTSAWFERPMNFWEGLDSTCKQIQNEISNLWPKAKLTWSIAADKLLFYDLLPSTTLRGLRCLSLEVSRDENIDYYETIGTALQYLNPYLSELRLFFVGPSSVSAPQPKHSSEQGNQCQLARLPPDSRNVIAKTPLFDAITILSRLSLLVLANVDTSINIGTLITAKPCLTHLRVGTDPRVLYDPHLGYRTRIPSKDLRIKMPPLRKLRLTANAVSKSLELFRGAMNYLEDVVWTVPSKDQEVRSIGYMKCTASLINMLRHAPKLTTFRICVSDPIDEDLASHGDFIAAIRYKLPLFRNLRTFEFHGRHDNLGRSIFFAQEIILQGLPDSVERFHTSESLIPTAILKDTVSERYLRADGSSESVGAGGRLGFIAYSYDASDIPIPERTKMTLLKLNGRLLDRERYLKKSPGVSWQSGRPLSREEVKNCPVGLSMQEARRWVEEVAVENKELPPLTWADDVDAEGGDHWMS